MTRSIPGKFAVAILVIGFICVLLAFFSNSWLVRDHSKPGALVDDIGLWRHCSSPIIGRSELDFPEMPRTRVYVACHWVFVEGPFDQRYSQNQRYDQAIRDNDSSFKELLIYIPTLFYSVTFLGTLLSMVLLVISFCISSAGIMSSITLPMFIGKALVVSGISALFADILYIYMGNKINTYPEFADKKFGFAFEVSVLSVILLLCSGYLFLVEARFQKTRRYESQHSQPGLEMGR